MTRILLKGGAFDGNVVNASDEQMCYGAIRLHAPLSPVKLSLRGDAVCNAKLTVLTYRIDKRTSIATLC